MHNLSGRDSEDSSFKAIQGRQGHKANFAIAWQFVTMKISR